MNSSRHIFNSMVLVCFFSSLCWAEPVDFVRDVQPILARHCLSCHGPDKQKSGLRLDIKAAAFAGGELYGSSILPTKPEESPLVRFVADPNADLKMPPEGPGLSPEEIALLQHWVREGAVWPDGVDKAQLEDRRDHWAYKPLSEVAPPTVQNASWPRQELDRFILAKLEQQGLAPAPEAERVHWLRRVYFDLIGLPPTPEQVAAFLASPGEEAYASVVEELLASPRYGERWAQHWLDVVRYADTHGFEVNTERPHAWPYRDYVIDAFNRDTPYDQFIREQIHGETLGQDAATGFLITASVLLPGQIGADEPSKRLARQDALDEIVINVGQTFLGLSVGCARCHDHKFDPISQQDYYSMQAFVAGVEYLDRELITPEVLEKRAQADQLKQRLPAIEHTLEQFVPLAHPESGTRRQTSPQENEESFSAREARFVRFEIYDCNLHPSLGLIEPCLDEFEIWTAEPQPQNVALASFGTKVTASGSNTSEEHKLEHIQDGKYGNSFSWMSDTDGRGWVQFELPEAVLIGKVEWGRDREGEFTDRTPTAYRLSVGLSPEKLVTVAEVLPLRPASLATRNVDRFPPQVAEKVRFAVLATNNLEPCIDELEVLDLQGKNIALASAGATVTASGSQTFRPKHSLAQVHDGVYGNSSSWMSSEMGQGWVEVTFAGPTEIDRVIWGRDREGKLGDRTPTKYRIEVADQGGAWRTVADHTDRETFGTEPKEELAFVGLSSAEEAQARALQEEQQKLERQIEKLSQGELVFAGTFREPDRIRVLRRGDPEQPLDDVVPAGLEILGEFRLSAETTEPERRQALAEWLTHPDNPLTARVMVNRIWQGHFGAALVTTPNDFGRNGAKPTHPDLLDWLARQFMQSGWSVKEMHRLIVLSATYRQATQINPQAVEIDADNRLLWAYPARRLEGEVIRDSMLAVSGRLNLQMGGRGFNLFDKRGGLTGFNPIESFPLEGRRRMVYAHRVRRERDAVFGAFDCPDAGQSTPVRRESTTPLQALNLFNSQFMLDESKACAERIRQGAAYSLPDQISQAYLRTLSREPTSEEILIAEPVVKQYGLEQLCRALFNSNEFLFVP